MSVTLQPTAMKYKDSNGNWQTVTCIKGADGSADLVAPDYSDLTFPVSAGTYCQHESGLYKANQAISVSETWTAAHWTECTVADELETINGAILPSVTSSDNGKVLQVVDGAWAAATIPAASGVSF